MLPEEQESPKLHVHTDSDHEAIADNIFAVVSDHIARNGPIGEFIKDPPVQLVPGASMLNEHIKNGRMPGGAEGVMIRKRIEADKQKSREENEKHVIK
jgi:hypothetical protein